MQPRSVASIHSCSGRMSLPARAWLTTSRMRPVFMSWAATLMAMCNARSWRKVSRISLTTVSTTRSVNGRISPLSSASAMKKSGRTMLPSGRRQRSSASAPMQRPLAISMMGW